MQPSALRVAVFVVAFAAQSAALGAESAAKPNPAAPAAGSTGDPLTATNLKDLKDAIAALHNRFEVQGTILAEVKTELATIRARVDEDLPVKLDPLKESILTLVRRSDEIKTAQGKLANAFDKIEADNTARSAELSDKLVQMQKQVAALEKLHDDLAQLRAAISNLNRPSATATPAAATASSAATLVGLAVCTALLAAFVLVAARAQRRASIEAVAAAIAQARDQIQNSLQQKLQSSSAELDRTLTGREQSVAQTLAQLQQLAERLERIDRRSDDTPTKSMPMTTAFDEKTTVPYLSPGEPSIPSQVVWSPPFLDPVSPLSRWRALLESHLASREHPALPVLAALLSLRLLLESPAPSLPDLARAVATLSEAAHAYWQSLADLSDDDRLRASADWIGGIKHLIAPVAPKLDIREVVPGARFDPDTMQTVQEGPGNHLNVATVFSWAVLDRSGERPKVLHRARIATT